MWKVLKNCSNEIRSNEIRNNEIRIKRGSPVPIYNSKTWTWILDADVDFKLKSRILKPDI
jgi:hypothetical protein